MFTQIVALALLAGGAPAPKAETEPAVSQSTNPPLRQQKRTEFLVNVLQTPLPLEKAIDGTPLKEVIEYLEDVSSPPESARDFSLRVKIIADDSAFKTARGENFRIEDELVRLPKSPGMSLETALAKLCDQVGGTYVIRGYNIEITTFEKVLGRQRNVGESAALVQHIANKEPLADLLDHLGTRYGRTVIVAPQVGEKAQIPVTLKLLNVPFDLAVRMVAETADLKVVRKDGALLVTTPHKAKEFEAELKARKKEEKPMPPPGGGV
jgi:hypothetical protein